MKRFLYLLAVLSVSALSPLVHATSLTYTESTIASGTLGGQSFTNALITLSATGNTTAVTFNGSAYIIVLPTSLTIAGLGTTTFTDSIRFVSNEASSRAGVGDTTTNRALLFDLNPFFSTYDLKSATAAITGTAAIDTGAVYATSLGSFNLTGDSGTATFQATAASATTPEPSTLLLFGTGLLFITAWTNRRSLTDESRTLPKINL